jgi:hypothetical protein
MAYKIFFSGLMVFVEYNDFEEVDVLLLNPCAGDHHQPGRGKHTEATHERQCLDLHLPQLTVKASDIAEWNLAGTLHGCGSRHFDLTGKTVFGGIKKGPIEHNETPQLDPYPVDPFGEMRHVSFAQGMVDMEKVLGKGNGQIDLDKVTKLLPALGENLIAARVRLPAGTLTALAPLDTSARQVVNWTVGQQTLNLLCETVLFEPRDKADNRIPLGGEEFITLKNKPDVTVWITDEPRVRTRFDPEKEFPGVLHFAHYYELMSVPTDAQFTPQLTLPKKAYPTRTMAAPNADTPPCPGARMNSPGRITP